MASRSRILRIGVFGGTFDPPHVGHLIIAEQALQQLRLDKVLFVPAFVPPHKKNRATASPQQRLAMVRRAIAGSTKFEVTTMEFRRQGISYTVDTLRELRSKYPHSRLFLIVGGDNYAGFRSWKSTKVILRLASIVVYKRNMPKPKTASSRFGKVTFLDGAFLDISSSIIRERVRRHESIKYLVPASIEKYIRQNGMYVRQR